jgi:hypothetical protein
VLYIDRPSPSDPSGIWSISIQGGSPAFLTNRLGIYSEGWVYRAFPEGETTVIERLEDGARWTIANGGRPVLFAPGNQKIAWTAGQGGPPFDSPVREIWVSNPDGAEARPSFQAVGAGLVGWLTPETLLVSGRDAPEDPLIKLWSVSLADGAITEILQTPGLRGVSLSPERRWLAYQVVFSGDAAQDGLWVVDLQTGETRRLDVFGAYQWRPGGRLLVIPLEPDASAHRIVEVDAATGETRQLTDPAVTPIRIANGEWAVSPDGRHIAWVSADDFNIWALEMPGS